MFRLNRHDEALELLAEAANRSKNHAVFRPALLAMGDIHFKRGEWKKAVRQFARYLEPGLDVPSADDALIKMGLAEQRQDRHKAALTAFAVLVDTFKDSPHRLHAMFECGQALVALDRADDAVAVFERVVAEGGDTRFAEHALNHLGWIATGSDDHEKAARRFAQVARAAPDGDMNAEALFQQGRSLMTARKFEKAEKVFAALVQSPDHANHDRIPEAGAQRAIALARMDRFDDALAAMEFALRADDGALPGAVRHALRYEQAWCLRSLGRQDEAAGAYRTLLDGLGDAADTDLGVLALLDLAGIEADAGRFEVAAKLLKRLRRRIASSAADVPDDVREQATYRLGVCAYELGRFDEAASTFEELIDRFPASEFIPSASFFCGEALLKTDHHERAVTHFARVADKHPSDGACGASLLRLGECEAVLQHWRKSDDAFTSYLDRFGDDEHAFQARFGIGWARENQSRYDDAIKAYRLVLANHQGVTAARAQFQIGECLFAQKKYADAARELLNVEILYAYPEWSAAALFEAGRCFEKLKKHDDARARYEEVREKYGDSKWAKMAEQRLAATAAVAPPGR